MTHRKDMRLPKSVRGSTSSRLKKLNRPIGQFAWFTREMMESIAWRSLSGNARSVIDRICIEHMSHGATSNGSLIVTHDNFADYGIRRPSIAAAIRAAEYFGFIRVIKGAAYKGEHVPNRYRLTWLPTPDCAPATNEWKAICSTHVSAFEAERKATNKTKIIASKARKDRRDSENTGKVVKLSDRRAS